MTKTFATIAIALVVGTVAASPSTAVSPTIPNEYLGQWCLSDRDAEAGNALPHGDEPATFITGRCREGFTDRLVAGQAAGFAAHEMGCTAIEVAKFDVYPLGKRARANPWGPGLRVKLMTSKRLELIRELVPTISRIALFANMSNAVAPPQWEETKTAARSLGIEAELLDVRSLDDVGRAFETAVGRHVDALLVSFDGLFQANARMIVELVARNRLPAIYVGREFIEAGGLMTYGVSFPDLYFRAATYVDKIFRGVKPADLPVEQPTKFELIINLKTAKALGLDVPATLLARADEVIE
jgi:hypothetical protein